MQKSFLARGGLGPAHHGHAVKSADAPEKADRKLTPAGKFWFAYVAIWIAVLAWALL
jgi:hypothetical protein